MSLHTRQRHRIGHPRHHRLHVRNPDRVKLGSKFGKLWGAGAASNLADGMSWAALPLIAAVLTRDPFAVAMIAALHSLPWIVFELVAGEIVDRSDRRKLMLYGNLARATTMSVIALLIATDSLELWSLGALAFATGMAETLVDTSWEAMVPRLVDSENLPLANGRSQATEWTANQLVGPPLGGLLFAVTASVPFFVNAGWFAIAAVLIAWIPGTFKTDREVEHGLKAMRKEIGDGIRWLWRHPVLRTLSLLAGTANLVATASFAVFVLFALEILGLSDAQFGLVLSASGVGGLIGAAIAHRLENRFGPGTMLLASMGGIGLAALAVAVTSSPLVVAAAFAVDGFLIALWNVTVVSLRQELTPDELRGRVASDARTIAFGAIPIGAILGGVLGDLVGLRAPFFLAAGTYAVAVVLTSRVVSNSSIAALRAEASAAE